MYEIWLAGNIVYELAWLNGHWLAALGAMWLVLWMLALRGERPRQFLPVRALIGIWLIGTLAGIATIPFMTHASFSDFGYWVDWANLFAIAAGTGAALALFAWPLLLTIRRR